MPQKVLWDIRNAVPPNFAGHAHSGLLRPPFSLMSVDRRGHVRSFHARIAISNFLNLKESELLACPAC